MSGALHILTPAGLVLVQRWEKSGPPPYDMLRTAVGNGPIERVRVRYEGKVRDAFVHEEGLLRGLPLNPGAMKILAPPFAPSQTIVGQLAIWVPDPKRRRT